jgi:hypothetical protein
LPSLVLGTDWGAPIVLLLIPIKSKRKLVRRLFQAKLFLPVLSLSELLFYVFYNIDHQRLPVRGIGAGLQFRDLP